jgi:phosphinothricin acetyltransferase
LKKQGYLNINVSIAYPDNEDEHLTKNSAEFHEHLGYRMVGEFHKCGYKFNRWYNLIWMEKFIGPHGDNPPPVTPFGRLPSE